MKVTTEIFLVQTAVEEEAAATCADGEEVESLVEGRGRGGAGAAGGRGRGRGGAGALGRGRGRGAAGHGRGRGRGGAQGRGIGRGRGRGGAGGLANFSEWDNVDDNRGRIRFVPSGRAPPDPEPRSLRSSSEKWAAKTNEKSWHRSDIKSPATVSSLNLVIYHVSS